MDQFNGKVLDNRYELLEVIGVGGMAVVYKAMDHRLNRKVAIKILKEEFLHDADFRRRFQAESQAVAMMSHPNIVNVYDVSKNDGVDYIVMELIDGITLKQYMERKGVLSWRETLHFSMQIAKALEHAHSRNIIHRDIKPHNIMILKDGSVKVADFGIARVASAQNTLTKEALGSVHYISPEQARGTRVDNRTDIYSLGVVMYQMLTGRTPYDGDSPVSIAIQHINGTPLLPSLLSSNIPTGLEQITMHAMCSDLTKRYASASDMLRDMEEFRKNPGVVFSFAADGSTESVTRPQPQTPPLRPSEPRQLRHASVQDYEAEERNSRKRILLTSILVFFGLIALVGIVYIAVRLAGANTAPAEPTAETQLQPAVPNLLGTAWDENQAAMYPDLSFELKYEYNTVYPAGTVCDQSVRPNTTVAVGTTILLTISMGEQTDVMPDFAGKSLDYAELYLKSLEITVTILPAVEQHDDVIESGKVIKTEPAAGATLKAGERITIYVSLGKEASIEVPDLYDKDVDEAKQLLEENNLGWYIVDSVESTTVEKDHVVLQTPAAGSQVRTDTIVNLTISLGKKTVKMPDVVGYSDYEAKRMLEELGFYVIMQNTSSSLYQPGYVCGQDVPAGTELEKGETVVIEVSNGQSYYQETDNVTPIPYWTTEGP